MFKLIRRISSSVFPRNDRPWADDATSTAPTIGTKRRISSVEMEVDTPVGSLSKKSRREKDTDLSDGEEAVSSPAASSPPPPRSLPPPEDVKEVTTGVKEIELDRKPDTLLSDPSAVVEPPVAPDAEASIESEERSETDENIPPEQRSGGEAGGSQDPAKDDPTNESLVKLVEQSTDDSNDTTKGPEEGAERSTTEPEPSVGVSPSKPVVEEPVDSGDE